MTKGTAKFCSATLLVLSSLISGSIYGEEVSAQEKHPTAGYDRKFFIQSEEGNFKFSPSLRLQFRYTFDSTEENGDRVNTNKFEIARARLIFDGNIFEPALTYKFQAEFGKGNVYLKDFYLDYGFAPEFHIRAGQWKRPFSRQQITSSGKLQLVDRSFLDKEFAAGRDIGIAFHNGYEKSPIFEWALGLFNGTGEKSKYSAKVTQNKGTKDVEKIEIKQTNVPKDFHPIAVLRVGYNYGGIKGYSEADFEGGGLRFSIGASLLADFDNDNDDRSFVQPQVDFMAKIHGFSLTGGSYLSTEQNGPKWADQKYASFGVFCQGGYLFLKKYEFALRYSLYDQDGHSNEAHEAAAGISLYFHKHNLKWQTDAILLRERDPVSGTSDDLAVRSQLQLSF